MPSGVPQGTKLGPWLSFLMINDLTVPTIFNMLKYVDDAMVSESIPKGHQSKSQEAVDAIYDWPKKNLFQLNGEKTKLHFLIQLKRAHVPVSDLVTYFNACISSSLDYACPVFHNSLPK